MIEAVFILTFFPFTFFLAQRNASSAQKRAIKGKVSESFLQESSLAIFRTRAWERRHFSGPWWELDVFTGPLGDAQATGEGTKPCPGQGIRCPPRSEVLGFAAEGFLLPPHPVPQLSLPAGPVLGLPWFICSMHAEPCRSSPEARPAPEEAVGPPQPLQPLCPSVERVLSPAFARFYGSHFHLPPSPFFPSLFFCRMSQGKENLWKRFQEQFSLPWC